MKTIECGLSNFVIGFSERSLMRVAENGFERSAIVTCNLIEVPSMKIAAYGNAMKTPADTNNPEEAMEVAFERMLRHTPPHLVSFRDRLRAAFKQAQAQEKVLSIKLAVTEKKKVLTPQQVERIAVLKRFIETSPYPRSVSVEAAKAELRSLEA